MTAQPWQGGKQDPRPYRSVRAEKQTLIREKYAQLRPHLEERGRRLWAATEAIAFGYGGMRAVAEALRMSQTTLLQGVRELTGAGRPAPPRPRAGSAGRAGAGSGWPRRSRAWGRPWPRSGIPPPAAIRWPRCRGCRRA